MRTGNTTENKAKFFALYWGQDVFRIKDGIDSPGSNFINNNYVAFSSLKPLESISDEDAKFIYCSKKGILRSEKVSLINYEFKNNVFCIEIYSPEYDSVLTPVFYFSIDDLSIRHIDYLRSKSYALPWMDLSVQDLIDYGWVKLEEL